MMTRVQAEANDRHTMERAAKAIAQMDQALDEASQMEHSPIQPAGGYHLDDVVFLAKLYEMSNGDEWYRKKNWELIIEASKAPDGTFSEENLLEQRWESCYGVTFKSRTHDGNQPYENGKQRLHRLEMLDNNLCGEMPRFSDCTSLVFVNIGHNHLQGQLPEDINRLTSLRYLSIYGNRFVGSIPASLGECVHLETVYLNANWLGGTVPNLSQLQELELLNVCSNNIDFSIPFPPHLLECTRLVTINFTACAICRVGRNQSGAIVSSGKTRAEREMRCIPEQVYKLSNLTALSCGNLKLVGRLPNGLFFLTKLTQLKLSYNELEGELPAEVGKLVHLQSLELDANKLTGSLPSSLAGLQNLSTLNLRYNKLEGPLPPEMANMTKLKVLDLRSNEGSGFIFPPGSIGAQRGLTSTWKAEAPKVLELFELAQPDEEQDVIETTTVPMPQELKSEISWLLGRLKPANANVNTSPQAGDEAEEVLPSLVMVPPDSPRMRRPVSPERQQYGDPRRAATSPTTVNRSWALRERYMPQ